MNAAPRRAGLLLLGMGLLWPAAAARAQEYTDGNGNVGVAISTPAAALDVSGNAQFGGGTTKSTFSASGYLTFSNISQPTPAPGRIYYDSSMNDLVFSTGTTSASWIAISTNSGGVPAGTVAYFNLTACPSGWTELSSAEGRYLVGLHIASTTALGTTVGTALSDQENRPVGQHSHSITDPGHSHSIEANNTSGACDEAAVYNVCNTGYTGSQVTNSATTGITINNAGSVAGTNAPYIELLVCQCTGPGVCQSGGSASSANGLSGGAANEIPYQTAPSNTSFTGAPGANSVLFANSGAPGWTNTPTLTGTNITGLNGANINNGTIIGPAVAGSTIPLSALNASGCSSGQVASYNGSVWTCGAGGGIAVTGSQATENVLLYNTASQANTISTFTVTSAGNFGVGVSTPAATLDVNGNAQFGGGTAKSTFSASGYLTLANISQPTPAPGRIYYDSSMNDLVFSTGTTSASWVSISTVSGGVPAGTVAYFNLTACPTGWTELSSAEGRYLVGLHAANPSSLGTAVGTALSDQENRATGQHTHTINDPGHTHSITGNGAPLYWSMNGGSGANNIAGGNGDNTGPGYQIINQSNTTGITINNAGSVAGTNAPYMELLVCQCTGPGVCQSGGSVSSAVGLAGGAANEVPYQTGPNNTTFTSAPGANSVLFANSGAPTWTNTPTLTGTNITGLNGANINTGTIIGPSVAASTIPLSALNASGCTSGQVASYNGSVWTCAPAGGDGVSSGVIVLMAGACPSNYTLYTAAQGMFIVGAPSGGTVAGTVGTALTDLAGVNLAHTHSFTPAGSLGGPTSTAYALTTSGDTTAFGTSAHSHAFTGSAGTTGSSLSNTNIPYIQLNLCQHN